MSLAGGHRVGVGERSSNDDSIDRTGGRIICEICLEELTTLEPKHQTMFSYAYPHAPLPPSALLSNEAVAKKSWRAWLERLVAGGPGAGGDQAEAASGAAGGGDGDGVDEGGEGALMKVVRVLGARLLGLSDPPKAPIGYGTRWLLLLSLKSCF